MIFSFNIISVISQRLVNLSIISRVMDSGEKGLTFPKQALVFTWLQYKS